MSILIFRTSRPVFSFPRPDTRSSSTHNPFGFTRSATFTFSVFNYTKFHFTRPFTTRGRNPTSQSISSNSFNVSKNSKLNVIQPRGRKRGDPAVPTSRQLDNFIQKACKQGDEGNIDKFYEQLRLQSITPSLLTYSALFEFCLLRGNLEKAEEYYEHMKESRSKMNITILNSLIDLSQRKLNLEKSELYFKELLASKIVPNYQTIKSMIRLCSKLKNFDKANTYFTIMEQFKISPKDSEIYHSMIDLSIECDPSKLSKFLEIMRTKKINLTCNNFNSLITFFLKIQDVKKAEECLLNMTNLQYPLSHAVHLFLQYAADKGNLEMTEKYVAFMHHHKLHFEQKTFNYLIKSCIPSHSLEKAEYYFKQMMVEYGHSPDVKSFDYILGICSAVGNVPKSEEYFSLMKNLNISPSSSTLSSLYVSYVKLYGKNRAQQNFDLFLDKNNSDDNNNNGGNDKSVNPKSNPSSHAVNDSKTK